NQELENAINAAEQYCDEDCSEAFILENLKTCFWQLESYNGDDHLMDYYLNFKGNDSLQVTTANLDTIEANWQVTTSSSGAYKLVIYNVIDVVNDALIFDDFDDDEFEFVHTISNTKKFNTMELDKNCSSNSSPFDCFEDVTVTASDFDND